MRIGVPLETRPGEKRVAATPASTAKFIELGYTVLVERGAGTAAGYVDDAYAAAGAQLSDAATVWTTSDLLLKVRAPQPAEAAQLHAGATLVCLLRVDLHPELPAHLCQQRVTALALEKIPRITRAQKMDVLSSTANLAGYRAVVEAAANFQGFFGGQMTAAGKTPPARVLIIGAGVAGLAAIAAARALGADVRAFDTRAAAREQVESLGATFLSVELTESGEGGGGYAREMSPAFIAAEMALFKAQAREVDVVITTALVPGKQAPRLLPRDVVECLRPGSVVVDMAAEQGGNCELTRADELVLFNGIRIIGYTDLASRMAHTASQFFATNVLNLITEMGRADQFKVDLANEVVRPAVVTHAGEVLPPLPPPPLPPPPPPKTAPAAPSHPAQQAVTVPTNKAWGTTLGSLVLIILMFLLGRFAPKDFLQHFTVFILACFVGWQVVWSVTPALHTPLMSVTNAISGIIIVGGMLQVGVGFDLASALGALAVLVAAINVAGGFLVTQRMLKMFRREGGAS